MVSLFARCAEVTGPAPTDATNGETADTTTLELPVVVFDPASPTSRDDVTALVANAAPGVSYTFTWQRDDGTDGPSGPELPAAVTERGERWTVTVVPVGAAALEGLSGVGTVVIGNSAPRCQRVELASSLSAESAWTCACAERDEPDAGDPSGEADDCAWVLNGEALPQDPEGGSSCVLQAPDVTRGDELRCVLTPTDGDTLGPPTSSPVLAVGNGAPTGGTATVEPAAPRELDLVRCEVQGAVDPDGDTLSWTVRWIVNDEVALEGSVEHANALTLSGTRFDEGDAIRCEAVAHDDASSSAPVVSAAVTVQNTPPVAESATISPTQARRDMPFTCTHVGGLGDVDPEDTPTLRVRWYHQPAGAMGGAGTLIREASLALGDVDDELDLATVTAATVAAGDGLECTIEGVDEAGPGPVVVSDQATVENSPPVAPAVVLSPTAATVASALTCEVDSALDPDGDPVSIVVSWSKNGTTLTGATGSTLAGVFAQGDAIACSVVLSDGESQTAVVSSGGVTIQGSAPFLASAVIEATSPGPCGIATCVLGGLADLDGPSGVTTSVVWRVDGAVVGDGASFAFADLADGAEVSGLTCHATAFDGALSSTEVSSSSFFPVNAAPTLNAAVLVPATAIPGDLLTCLPVGFNDPDCGVAPSVRVEWTVDGGEPEAGAISALGFDTSALSPGQNVACHLIASDGELDAPARDASLVLDALPVAAPQVTVEAPTGAGGPITCAPVGGEVPEGLIWHWWIGAGAPFLAGPVLDAGLASDCDRVRCQAEATGGVSNIAERVLAFGPGCDDGELCTKDACSPLGGCLRTYATGECDDGEPCTIFDACVPDSKIGGFCNGLTNGCDDENPCTGDACEPGVGCTFEHVAAGCSDGSVCTAGDVCFAGGCKPGAAVSCDDGDSCSIDSCDPISGCVSTPGVGGICNDQNPCTALDQCGAFGCMGSPVPGKPSCSLQNGAGGYCGAGVCNANQAPSAPTVAVTPSQPAALESLQCTASGAVDPDAWPDPITYSLSWRKNGVPIEGQIAAQLPGSFVTKGATISCRAVASDGLDTSLPGLASVSAANAAPVVSSVTVTAVGGGPGIAGAPLTCVVAASDPDGDSLSTFVNWRVNGALVATTAVLSGAQVPGCARVQCDATVSDGATTAVGASPFVQLDAGIACGSTACRQWSCTAEGACTSTEKTGSCDDGDACTGPGTCQAGTCLAEPIPLTACDDDNPCTVDSCVAASGCVHQNSTGDCDADGSACTLGDACVGGSCVPGPPRDCSDGVSCTSDVCDPLTGCVDAIPPAEIAFPITFTDKAGMAVPDGAGLEVVKGLQGGEHVEYGLRLVLPPAFTWSPVSVRVVVVLRGTCCDGPAIASGTLNTVGFGVQPDGSYLSTSLLTFMSTASAAWVTKPACLEVTVSARGQNGAFLATTRARHGYTLQDLF